MIGITGIAASVSGPVLNIFTFVKLSENEV